jgi:prevent-host-death family protein
MRISITDAKGQLTELVRRAETGHEIVLTRDGHAAVRLVPVKTPLDSKSRSALIEQIQASAKPSPGARAARSQDFLYEYDGLPR